VLQRFFPPEISDVSPAREALEEQVRAAGPMTSREKRTAVVAAVTIVLWMTLGEKAGMATIALGSACTLFAVGALSWQEAEESVNWGVLLMYGGAIALGTSLVETRATEWLAQGGLELFSDSPAAFIAVTGLLAFALTEVMSNAACVAVLLPIALSASQPLGIDPRLVMLAVTIPSGLGYTLPVGTPPNAIAFSSGFYSVRNVVVPGLLLTVISYLVFVAASRLYWPYLPH
jgi:sodium-dependent dicarboxylate transporter 2/3/5